MTRPSRQLRNCHSLLFTTLLTYGLVFGLETSFVLLAIALLRRVNFVEFPANAQQAIATIVNNDLS
ncbi:hypothetical protein [Chroococcidiopsis sp. CCMEE 29]|uniref:hypothetical protein n=1 Tax=Chroococcidiopsis sp. CCMEE 29 TaxID=155894 RepID=UPI002021AC7E|nr:hypothetical protein [Chroococcidiopsis sp. CCMEE 29]